SVAARPVQADPDHDGRLPRDNRAGLAALRRTRDHTLWRARRLPRASAARGAAAAGNFYLEPAARARLAARPLGCAHRAGSTAGGIAHLCRRAGLWHDPGAADG